MRFDDPLRGGEAKAGSSRLGGEERRKQALANLRWDARSPIGDHDLA